MTETWESAEDMCLLQQWLGRDKNSFGASTALWNDRVDVPMLSTGSLRSVQLLAARRALCEHSTLLSCIKRAARSVTKEKDS